ncbi:Bifunctional protein pyrR [Flexistipes sinusarabici DSM 4947]|uniref:Bifunctional protein PyrR n=2 Tax=Flexistipes sinusarabici TaxID=2352 RepID=F8E438_FLESM|nr:bifunctional pyr operon transcriptional regulator/uracil phosphoribosyltransferase PyrR [Flexistipes sinusarabici]AEI14391.1 Bifunctional protein pyrR [Flexistipes sinusarabici DSM 4947]HCW93393.1 bifunctional pyr operon transcriptional regulator/uracil phosphoribosyltransferase PyrR [Flexistipes sinusarabici]
MNNNNEKSKTGKIEKEILNKHELDSIITRITFQILEKCSNFENIALIGIKRRGAILADRINDKIKEHSGKKAPVGYLDITLYRDDLTEIADYPLLSGTEIDFRVKGKNIILIDDVIFTGRTVRSALDAIIDFGRPEKIILACLIDRGHRELPIQADFTGKYVPTSLDEKINVKLKELDKVDSVSIEKNEDGV